MVVQSPPPLPPIPASDVDAGVIIDARLRQRRHHRIAAVLLTLAAVGALFAAGVGGGGGGPGSQGGTRPGSPNPGGGAAHAGSNSGFPGAPRTQQGAYGVQTRMCRLAPRNRYLPARVGCLTSIRADMNGDGRADLVLVYSTLGRRHPGWFAPGTAPPGLQHEYVAKAAFLRVVLAGGGSDTARIPGAWAAAIDARASVSDEPGTELFLEVTRTSSGAAVLAYGFARGHLVAAGAVLGFGGDSASKSSFDCLAGSPPRLVQRFYELIGPNVNGWWRETRVLYAWHGAKLVKIDSRSFRRHGAVNGSAVRIGRGCIHGVG